MIQSKTASGVEIPSLGLGTWELSGESCTQAVAKALGVGYRHLDTAQLYQNEKEVGDGIRSSEIDREGIFLTTKIFRNNLSVDRLIPSVENSLRNLQTEYVDLLLIHWPNKHVPLEHSLGLMERLRADGKARHLGVSNFPPSWLKRAITLADLACIQVEYHPFLSQETLLELARENDLVLTAYSPLGKGRVFRDETLKSIASEHGKTVAQIVLRWLIQQEPVVTIPRSTNLDHIRSNFDVWDFELSLEDMQRIFGLARGQRIVNPSFIDWERPDEALWWKGRRIPRTAINLITGFRRAKKRLRKIIR